MFARCFRVIPSQQQQCTCLSVVLITVFPLPIWLCDSCVDITVRDHVTRYQIEAIHHTNPILAQWSMCVERTENSSPRMMTKLTSVTKATIRS